MLNRTEDPIKQKKSKIYDNHFENCAYSWLAPEILANGSKLYSLPRESKTYFL